jgi:FNIP Repeat
LTWLKWSMFDVILDLLISFFFLDFFLYCRFLSVFLLKWFNFYVQLEFHREEKMIKYTPKRVIVYSLSAIPQQATHLILFLVKQNENDIHPIDNLPPTLTHLILGLQFNQPLDQLPPTLTHLTIGQKFNYPVDKLPPALTHLNCPFFQPTSK